MSGLVDRVLGLFGGRADATPARRPGAPLALVYRGPAARPEGCSEAVAALLAASRHGFDVRYVGPDEDLPLTAETLAGAALYAQPGGGTLSHAYKKLRHQRGIIRDHVAGGGRYLGFCLGGYLAGATPGFGLLPGDTDRYIDSPGATVDDDEDTLVGVSWRGRERTLFFQDGPHFLLERDARVSVLGRYPNGTVAALVAPFGAGRVGVVGPHPEATADWFGDARLPMHDARDLGLELIDTVMS
ncbi:glutamine amidotransferase-like uncharacterized protein [Pseudonocardia sediminis]|uniref:Glutamine amidotransferase-like uncharacterized protein n=1 Tax=Pseudonocardia sediminis TaxID=1397368 RepID=A0A4Q7V1Q1_PSEST|nr:BPL-N domain-containing protein [Pseudonocardia sediminis]RZT86533.1 glutamine amidotransferase-like uncharacterized protein [Pseudonocardia sediminis]